MRSQYVLAIFIFLHQRVIPVPTNRNSLHLMYSDRSVGKSLSPVCPALSRPLCFSFFSYVFQYFIFSPIYYLLFVRFRKATQVIPGAVHPRAHTLFILSLFCFPLSPAGSHAIVMRIFSFCLFLCVTNARANTKPAEREQSGEWAN